MARANKIFTNMTYDEALKRVEEIVIELEQAKALSMDEYKIKATEAKRLLDFCEQQISGMNYSSDILTSTSR